MSGTAGTTWRKPSNRVVQAAHALWIAQREFDAAMVEENELFARWLKLHTAVDAAGGIPESDEHSVARACGYEQMPPGFYRGTNASLVKDGGMITLTEAGRAHIAEYAV